MSNKSASDMLKAFDGVEEFKEPTDDSPEKAVLNWRGRSFTFWVKAIDYLQEVDWQRRLAAMCGGHPPRSFDNYHKMRAICIVRTCIPLLPDWVTWLILNDDEAAISIANKFEEKTYSFRAKHGAARDEETGEAGFSITS